VTDLKKNQAGRFVVAGAEVYVARTGYTGEDGFEVIAPAATIENIWNALLSRGHAACLQPCGLGARDTLRTEMCYPLYGHELDEETTPVEAGVGFFVSLDKGAFIGREVLVEQKARGVSKRCVAFKMTGKTAPPRAGYPIWTIGNDSSRIGTVTSGTQSPSLGVGIGLGYLPPGQAKPGTPIEIEIRGRRAPAVVVAKPIYRKENS
jgi:aminomethyltransferase